MLGESSYFRPKRRTRKCRFCGREFSSVFPAKRTCDRPECQAQAKALKTRQNRASQKRWLKRIKTIRDNLKKQANKAKEQ